MRLRNFACFLFAAAALGQVAVQGPQSVYEGQNVAEIDLVANPHRDVEPLRSLLDQKPAQPYSQAKVETSIKALQDTGQFPKVQVNVVPDPAGLRLNFLLEASTLLGATHIRWEPEDPRRAADTGTPEPAPAPVIPPAPAPAPAPAR